MCVGWAAVAGLAVAAGAFGAHGLKEIVSAGRLARWETAARYQMYHGLALLVLGSLGGRIANRVVSLFWDFPDELVIIRKIKGHCGTIACGARDFRFNCG